VLNIIVQNILEKRKNEGKGTLKTLMPPTWVQKLDGGKNLKGNLEVN
jgi:hypothetical protein